MVKKCLILAFFVLFSCAKQNGKSTNKSFSGKNQWKSIANHFKEPNELKKRIEEYLGVPYLWGGTTKDGMDCSAFVQQIYATYNINLPRTSVLQSKIGIKIPKSSLLVGDLVFFGNTQTDSATHVGIYTGENKFANATTSQGIKYSDLDEPFFSSTYLFAKRLKF